MRPFLLAAFLVFILSACEHQPAREKVMAANLMLIPPSSPGADIAFNKSHAEKNTADTGKKIIKSGNIIFETKNLKVTRERILLSLRKMNGYVAEESETNDSVNNQKQYVLQLRVPAKYFDPLIDSISSTAGKIDSKNISIRDVTSQFIDVKAQLADSRALESTYLGLLKKAGKMSDVLQIESKLTEIRTSIDSTQGVLNYLSKQVDYSSLNLTFYTRQVQQVTGDTLGSKFKTSISDGWEILQGLFFGIISLWPLILLAIASYFFIKRWRVRRKHVLKQ